MNRPSGSAPDSELPDSENTWPVSSDRWPGITGIDWQQAKSLWDDPHTYRQYLDKFVARHGHTVMQLRDLLAQSQPQPAQALAHALAGSAGNLALTQVRRHAVQLEQLLDTEQAFEAELEALAQAMSQALACIAGWTRLATDTQALPPINPASGAATAEELGLLLRDIFRALQTDSPGPAELLLMQLARYLPRDQIAPIQAALEDFDFSVAKTRLTELAASLDVDTGAWK